MISFWQVMDRAYNTGPLMKVEKFDMEVFRKATDLKNKFGVQFDPEIPVPENDDLADRVFQAGIELFLEVGVHSAGSVGKSDPVQSWRNRGGSEGALQVTGFHLDRGRIGKA